MLFTQHGFTLNHEESYYLDGSTQAQEFEYDDAVPVYVRTMIAEREYSRELWSNFDSLAVHDLFDEKSMALTSIRIVLDRAVYALDTIRAEVSTEDARNLNKRGYVAPNGS